MGDWRRSVDQVQARAIERAGLTDFGADSFREGLEILMRASHDVPAPPSAVDRMEDIAVNGLTNRLRLTDYVKRHPEVLDVPVEKPLFIIGMPRSGTTVASYVVGQDPARRSLLVWEAWESVPPPTTETLKTDPRCLARVAAQQAEWAKTPGMVRPHVEFEDGPTECLRLHSQDFKAIMFEGPLPVKEYSRWMMDTDMTSAYAYQKMALQVLQSKAPGRWSLKMPSHALHVEALYRVFPDARIVWTHRDPYEALASLFSMKSASWMRNTGDPNVEWLREHYPRQLGEHVNRPMRLRERIGQDKIFDLYYGDMLRDPIGVMQRLYAWAGDEFTPQAEAAMRQWLADNPQGRFGKHSYNLEQFGLTQAALKPFFSDYLDVHGKVLEAA